MMKQKKNLQGNYKNITKLNLKEILIIVELILHIF